MGTEPESVDAQKGTMKDIFMRCLKKNIAQVCTLLNSCAHCKEEFQLTTNLIASITGKLTFKNYSGYVTNVCVNLLVTASILSRPFPCTNMSCNNRCLFFRRLKINHESHEFTLDPGTVANSKDK
jgi:hypothetical protein